MTPEEIREARNKKDMTQIQVASAVGVSVAAYRLWEAGGGNPLPENEVKLIEVLGGNVHAREINSTSAK
jgi:transcriptional regulator with XRE-family HTH domain